MECNDKCLAEGKCNLFAYGNENGKNNCLFNAPLDCKVESGPGYKTYQPAVFAYQYY